MDFLNSAKARPIRILAEFSEPHYRFLEHEIDSTIVFFGSARIKPKELAKKELFKAVDLYEQKATPKNEHKLSAARLQLRFSQ